MANEIYFLEIKASAPDTSKKLFYFTNGKIEMIYGEDCPEYQFYHCFGIEKDTFYLTGEHMNIPVNHVSKLVPIDDDFINNLLGEKAKRFKYVYNTLKRNL